MAWAPDYVTASELKAYLRIGDTQDDAQLGFAITAASRAIDRHCRRQFGSVSAEERVYTPEYDRHRRRWLIPIDDLMTAASSVEIAGEVLVEYTLEPRNAAAKGKPWELLVVDKDATVVPCGEEYEAAITAAWGWTAVPTTVKHACLLQASRFFKRRDSPFGIAGSPDVGSELRLLAKVDPDVAVSLRPVLKWWAAA
jgi:hypothetical protein